ncbi:MULTISPECIES: RNase adapter RapZ [unclassified Rothia (in: high G+C Gram-positive bacteria)]|uniref:RNase adapter RapZ n=1 Tax=unclassified Rothia (in: high G+C Gram-positive bacteria) TaxID=2689056 RepID=UPI001958259A|nr:MULTISPECIES: RNase adapter RapZ [unclassified Rothia (in: high G+C Gram-positive bacteria)]MBM7050614.1 RNase adapter RapZ [Rothia sp. ZJ1223]QRZ60808.1 RNase adapter RapZ [Rothia sp. ZJ932]
MEAVKDLKPQILVITGISGSGRSTAANTLEDEGWYVVDNMPPQMLKPLAEVVAHAPEALPKLALGIDVRSMQLDEDIAGAIERLRTENIDLTLLFMDASDKDIIARYEAQRRPHPLQGEGRIMDGITKERALFEDLKMKADTVIDTSGKNVHQLAHTIREMFNHQGPKLLNLTLTSFGFKYGAPVDANMMVDMRFIPNPHWVPELRAQTGQDVAVRDYVFSNPGTEEFVSRFVETLRPVLDGYRREGKHYATIAIGCTGGKHRSVAVTEELAKRLRTLGTINVNVQHRDMGRE